MNNEGHSASLSSSIDDEQSQSVMTMESGENGVEMSFLQARSLDAIPSRRFVASSGVGRGNGNGARGGRRRRATAPAHQSAASRTSATIGDCRSDDDGCRRVAEYVQSCTSASSLHPVADGGAALAKQAPQLLNPIGSKLTAVSKANGNGCDRASTAVSRIVLANGTRANRSGSPPKREGLDEHPRRTKTTARSSVIGLSAPTLLHGRHAAPLTAHSTGVDDKISTNKIPSAASAANDAIYRSAADVKHGCFNVLADVSPVDDATSSVSNSQGASRRVGVPTRGTRLSFDINPFRRWSHQRAVGINTADCWTSGSAISVYETPFEHLTPEHDPIVLYRSPPVDRAPPDVIGKAADAERAVPIMSATSFGAGSSSRRVSMNTCGQYMREHLMSFSQPSDNRLAMKLFGNKNAFVRDKLRRSQVLSSSTVGSTDRAPDGAGNTAGSSGTGIGSWLIHPCSNFRYAASIFSSICERIRVFCMTCTSIDFER